MIRKASIAISKWLLNTGAISEDDKELYEYVKHIVTCPRKPVRFIPYGKTDWKKQFCMPFGSRYTSL